MITPHFKDEQTRESLARNGFVVLRGLAKEALSELCAVYEEMIGRTPASDSYFQSPMTGTNFLADRSLRNHVTDRITAIIAPLLIPLLDGYRFIGAGLRVKQVGPDSALSIHQDPTMVDEDQDWSINIIVPLVDTTSENGALQVISGSHKYMPKVRSMDLNDRVDVRDRRVDEEIPEEIETIPMQAGDAIFYYNSILHGSGPNRSGQARPVVLGTLLSEETPMILYLRSLERPTMVERYEVPDKFFSELENFDQEFKLRPKNGRRIDDVLDTNILTREQLLATIRSRGELVS